MFHQTGWEILKMAVNSPREGTAPLSMECSLHRPCVAASGTWADLSRASAFPVPQAWKPAVVFNTHSSKSFPRLATMSHGLHTRRFSPVYPSSFIVSDKWPTASTERTSWPSFLTEHLMSGRPSCSTPGGAVSTGYDTSAARWSTR